MDNSLYRGGFRDLEVWKEAKEFQKEIASIIKKFPPDEKFLLINQLLRASRGITSCIAEGYGRYHYQENIQYCRMARGSLMECLDHIIVALNEEYIDKKTFIHLESKYFRILKLINGYIHFLKKRKAK